MCCFALSPQKVQQGNFFSLCHLQYMLLLLLLSIKHSEQLQTWQVQSQTCSGQDMLVSHRAGCMCTCGACFFLFTICQAVVECWNDGAISIQTVDVDNPSHVVSDIDGIQLVREERVP